MDNYQSLNDNANVKTAKKQLGDYALLNLEVYYCKVN